MGAIKDSDGKVVRTDVQQLFDAFLQSNRETFTLGPFPLAVAESKRVLLHREKNTMTRLLGTCPVCVTRVKHSNNTASIILTRTNAGAILADAVRELSAEGGGWEEQQERLSTISTSISSSLTDLQQSKGKAKESLDPEKVAQRRRMLECMIQDDLTFDRILELLPDTCLNEYEEVLEAVKSCG